MTLSANKLPRWLTLGLVFPLVVLNGWLLLLVVQYFQPLVNVFVSAILLAFILEYPVQFLHQAGVKRNTAVLWVFLVTSIILVAVGLTLGPIILEQLNELANRLPSWINSGSQQLQSLNDWADTRNLPINLSGVATQLTERLSGQLQTLSGKVLNFAIDTIGSVLNILLTVVLTFYFVLNSEQLWGGIFQWLPPNVAAPVQRLLRQNFHNYFIGQATLATIIGFAMTLAFLTLRVPLGLLFGLGIGFLALFPFGTGVGISLVSLLVALQNFWLGVEVLAVAVAIDQVNANFIAPRILGGFTGLNPVWIFASLLIGAKIGGLLGVLIAVPLASFIKSMAESMRTTSRSDNLDSQNKTLTSAPALISNSLAEDSREAERSQSV
ncbi:MAG: AI-2E family transporter [Chamaesiphon sp.]